MNRAFPSLHGGSFEVRLTFCYPKFYRILTDYLNWLDLIKSRLLSFWNIQHCFFDLVKVLINQFLKRRFVELAKKIIKLFLFNLLFIVFFTVVCFLSSRTDLLCSPRIAAGKELSLVTHLIFCTGNQELYID